MITPPIDSPKSPHRRKVAPPVGRPREAPKRSTGRRPPSDETQGVVWLGFFVSLASVCVFFIIAALSE